MEVVKLAYQPCFCKIELSENETRAIMSSLSLTMSKGYTLTISMELEDKLCDMLNQNTDYTKNQIK